jgi:hypothetical protein
MLEFDEDEKNAQLLGIHYATMVGDKFVIDFMSSKESISTPEHAIRVTTVFWKMVELSIDDNAKGVSVDGISDLEFWMYKLFNDVSGYVAKRGFKNQWDKTTQDVKS